MNWEDRHKAKNAQEAMEYAAAFPYPPVFSIDPEHQQELGRLLEYCECYGFKADLDAIELACAKRYCESSDLDEQRVMDKWGCDDLVKAVAYQEGYNQYTNFEYWRSSSIGC